MLNKVTWLLLGLIVIAKVADAADEKKENKKPPQWITEGPYVEATSFSLELPLKIMLNKLYVELDIGGKPRHFVLDTGSPSMMTSALAAELGLAVVDTRESKNSHGAIIKSNIVQIDLTLGGVVFKRVPMFVADFCASKMAQCFIGDGVLGSEILPLCAWQIDLSESVLRCHSDVGALNHVTNATKQTLYDFGYPHTPIL